MKSSHSSQSNLEQYIKQISEAQNRIANIKKQILQQKNKRQLLDQLSQSEQSSEEKSNYIQKQHIDTNRNQEDKQSESGSSAIEQSQQSKSSSIFIKNQYQQIQAYMAQLHKQKDQKISARQEYARKLVQIYDKQSTENQVDKTLIFKKQRQLPYGSYNRRHQKVRQAEINLIQNSNRHKEERLSETKKIRNYRIFEDQNKNLVDQAKINGQRSKMNNQINLQRQRKTKFSIQPNPVYLRIQQRYNALRSKLEKKQNENINANFQQDNESIHRTQISNKNQSEQNFRIDSKKMSITSELSQLYIIPVSEKRHSQCYNLLKKGSDEYRRLLKKVKKQESKCMGLQSRLRDMSVYSRITANQ